MLIETVQTAIQPSFIHETADAVAVIVALPLVGTAVRIAWLLGEMKNELKTVLNNISTHSDILKDAKPKVDIMWDSHERRRVSPD